MKRLSDKVRRRRGRNNDEEGDSSSLFEASDSTFMVSNNTTEQQEEQQTTNDNNEEESSRYSSSYQNSTRSSSVVTFTSSNLLQVARLFENGVKVSDRRYHFKVYKNVFVGREAVDFLVRTNIASNRTHAVKLGNALMREFNLLEHVCRQHDFKDSYLFYNLVPPSQRLVSIQDEIGCLCMMEHAFDDDESSVVSSTSNWSSSTSGGSTLSKLNLPEVAQAFEAGIQTKDHWFHLKCYKDTFVGSDAVDFLILAGHAKTRWSAVRLGQALSSEYNLFQHVMNDHEFKDDYLFYKFTSTKDRLNPQLSKSNKLSLQEVSQKFEQVVKVKNHFYRLKPYPNTFVGSRAVDAIVKSKLAPSRREAVKLGRKLKRTQNLFEHVCQEHDFYDDYFFYQYCPPERRIIVSQQNEEQLLEAVLSSSNASSSSTSGLQHVANEFAKGVRVKTHRYHVKSYPQTFVGSQAVDFMVNSSLATTRKEAIQLGRRLASELHLFEHVTQEHLFKDDHLFYKFCKDRELLVGRDHHHDEDDDNMSDITTSEDALPLEQIAVGFKSGGVKVKDRKYHLKTYKNVFVGRDAVDWLIQEGWTETRQDAVDLGRQLCQEFQLFQHVTDDHELEDDYLFYRFCHEGKIIQRVDDTGGRNVKELYDMAKALERGVAVRDHRYHLRIYKNTFVGSEAVDFLIRLDPTMSRQDAVRIGRVLVRTFKLFQHVCRQHDFKDEHLFYSFLPVAERRSWTVDKRRESIETTQETIISSQDSVPETSTNVSNERLKQRSYSLGSAQDRLPKQNEFRLAKAQSMPLLLEVTVAERATNWCTTFRRTDPRYQILSSVNDVAQQKAFDFKNIDTQVIAPLMKHSKRASVFSVWRPTSFDAIRKMMLGEATGKGLDIKGKSAKRGKMSALVPFLQISENKHKKRVRPLPQDGRLRLYFNSQRARDIAASKLETVAEEMLETVEKAKQVLSDDKADKASRKDAVDAMLLDVADPSIANVDEYSPKYFGLDLAVRLFWEAYFVQQDCTRKPGSEFDTGRPSVPAFQDMNFASLRKDAKDGAPRAVVLQLGDARSAMSPFELVMAYEEHGRVLPVVSDFDCFLVGTKGVTYQEPMPSDQLEVMQWSISQIERILQSPPRCENWTSRWLEILKDASRDGFHPHIPKLGFGDPTSYSLMEDSIQRLTDSGPVRHGAECFNFYFPQDLDDEYLVLSDTLPGKVPWEYVDVNGLQDFLESKIGEGYTFPLNPKHILCDSGRWKELFDELLMSESAHVQDSLEVWYPRDSGIRENVEKIHALFPNGFERQSKSTATVAA